MDLDDNPDYLDLDDILAQAQSVTCKFLLDIPGLEFLTSDESQDVTQGSVMLLPFWMAKTLYTYSMIDIDLPKYYDKSFRDQLAADADVVDLHKAGPHYYKFGKLLINLRREYGNNLAQFTEEGQRNKYRREEGETIIDRKLLAGSLIDAFHKRRHTLLGFSKHSQAGHNFHGVTSFESRLDNMEKRLFRLGRQQDFELKKWESRQIEVVANNEIATRLHKRRKLERSSSHQS